MALSLSLPVSQPVFAQDDDALVEEIVVTGSRVPRADQGGVAPVATYSSEEIDRSGATSIGQFLREIPAAAGRAHTTQINFAGVGTMQISLRGMGAHRTLVLLNGRRVVSSFDPRADRTLAVDLNTIPVSIIERVDVLKDGASAVYGSDAVAGVVNIITKRRFKGIEMNAFAGDTTRGGGARHQVDLTLGGPGDSMIMASVTDEKEIEVGDREWAQSPLYHAAGETIFLGSPAPPWGRYRFTEKAAGRDCDGDGALDGICDLTLGREFGEEFRTFSYFEGDSYNYAPLNYQRQPNTRGSLFFFGENSLDRWSRGPLGDVSGYFEAIYTKRLSEAKLAEVPLAPFAFDGHDIPYSKDNYYNPFGVDIPDWRRRMVEGGPRLARTDEDTARFLVGLRGDWSEGPFDGWSWEAFGAYAESRRDFRFKPVYDYIRLENAVGPTTGDSPENLRCVNDTDNCVPLNIFGENSVTREMLDYVTFETSGDWDIKQQTLAVSLTTPTLFQLPAGPVGAAFGIEYRDEFTSVAPDYWILVEDAVPSPGYRATEAYLEVVLPLLAESPLAESLEAEVAVRYSDYDAYGSMTLPKIGLRWRIRHDVVLRGGFSTVFRVPSIRDLRGTSAAATPGLVDPCAGGRMAGNVCMDPRVPDEGFEITSTQLPVDVGGRAALDMEHGDALTLGVVWTPETSLAGLSLALDYYDFQLEDVIGGLGADFILSACARRGELCDRIRRFADGNVYRLDNRTANVGGLDASGVDLSLAYPGIDLPAGKLDLRLDLTRILAHDHILPDGTVIENAGWFRENRDGHLGEWKLALGLDYALGTRFDASWDVRFIDDVLEEYQDHDTGEVLERPLDGVVYHDLQANWRFRAWCADYTVGVGIDNILDEAPPLSLGGFNDNADVRTFDTAGRFIYARVRIAQ